MSRLQSFTLPQFLAEQQELQRVGSTPLERQISSLTGGVQRSELPQSVQDAIQARTQALGGRPGGPLVINNPFTDESLSLEQQKQLANQIAINQGAASPFPEVGAPQSEASGDLTSVARETTQNLAPLVQQGFLGSQDARKFVRQTVLDTATDQNLRDKAQAQVRAVAQQLGQQRISLQQAADTVEQLRNEFGSVLNSVPEWQQLTGTEGVFEQQATEAVQEFADSVGLPAVAYQFDRRSGQVVENERWWNAMGRKSQIAEMQAKPALEAIESQQKILDERLRATRNKADKAFSANVRENPQAALDQYTQIVSPAMQQYKEMSAELNTQRASILGMQDVLSPKLREEDLPLPTIEPKPATHPKLPTGVNLFGSFDSVAAAKAASPKPGVYLTIEGSLFRINSSGVLESAE